MPAASEGRELPAYKVRRFKSPFAFQLHKLSHTLADQERNHAPHHFCSAFKAAEIKDIYSFQRTCKSWCRTSCVLFVFIVITVLFLLWDIRQTFLSLMKEQKHPLRTWSKMIKAHKWFCRVLAMESVHQKRMFMNEIWILQEHITLVECK